MPFRQGLERVKVRSRPNIRGQGIIGTCKLVSSFHMATEGIEETTGIQWKWTKYSICGWKKPSNSVSTTKNSERENPERPYTTHYKSN